MVTNARIGQPLLIEWDGKLWDDVSVILAVVRLGQDGVVYVGDLLDDSPLGLMPFPVDYKKCQPMAFTNDPLRAYFLGVGE